MVFCVFVFNLFIIQLNRLNEQHLQLLNLGFSAINGFINQSFLL